jgi:hypothetical protein
LIRLIRIRMTPLTEIFRVKNALARIRSAKNVLNLPVVLGATTYIKKEKSSRKGSSINGVIV